MCSSGQFFDLERRPLLHLEAFLSCVRACGSALFALPLVSAAGTAIWS